MREIRTALLKTKIPTLVFIRNNAASAGALISIACDSIYMMPGATIGAACVVNQEGEMMPEKYQSYMRKKLGATAEETGRDPKIAEGMADENSEIDSIKPKGKIVTFTTDEALKHGYCNAKLERPEEILTLLAGGPYVLEKHESSLAESAVLWLVNPAVSGVFLLLIFGGIYFEFKAPGTLLPLGSFCGSRSVYFRALYGGTGCQLGNFDFCLGHHPLVGGNICIARIWGGRHIRHCAYYIGINARSGQKYQFRL
ncbi:MAG: hypothetical protein IPH78_13100 [Bacteroidetes bacterium]|nr:hypothetical protein [Bacteroidota bacterium]